MWIIGLTGALGAGKTTLSRHCQGLGIPVHCADKAIHALLATDKDVFKKIQEFWPESIVHGKIERALLGEVMFSSPGALSTLEGILYPKLAPLQKQFLEDQNKQRASLVVLDVPLLFEVGLAPYCHSVILATAPRSLREERVLSRPGMSKEKFEFFETHRMLDEARLPLAHTVISTGPNSLRELEKVFETFSKEKSPAWSGEWPQTLARHM